MRCGWSGGAPCSDGCIPVSGDRVTAGTAGTQHRLYCEPSPRHSAVGRPLTYRHQPVAGKGFYWKNCHSLVRTRDVQIHNFTIAIDVAAGVVAVVSVAATGAGKLQPTSQSQICGV